MSEWWTYTLSDFLLFSAKTYYRLFELYNRDVWPAQIAALALGGGVLWCLQRRGERCGNAVSITLAACWLWVAWAFHAQRYASINWAANYFAIAFALQALLLLWFGLIRGAWSGAAPARVHEAAGRYLLLFALAAQPLLGPLLGRPWTQAEIFGIAPGPTVTATLGVSLCASRGVWPLMLIPLAWCILGGATLWAMHARDAWFMPLAGLLAIVLAARKSASPRN